MSDDFVRQQLDLEVESMSVNQLNDLGNQAIALGLIVGHGYHQGQYEILHKGKLVTLPPTQALRYLQDLLATVTDTAE